MYFILISDLCQQPVQDSASAWWHEQNKHINGNKSTSCWETLKKSMFSLTALERISSLNSTIVLGIVENDPILLMAREGSQDLTIMAVLSLFL